MAEFERSADPEGEVERGFSSALRKLDEALAGGACALGWKVAFNVPAVQAMLGLHGSIFGCLDPRARLESGSSVRVRAEQDLRVEAELALRIDRDVLASADLAAARAAIGGVAPAIELVDQHLPQTSLEAMVGHSAFHRATMLGEPQPLAATAALGLGTLLPRVVRDGQLIRAAESGLVPDDLGEIVLRAARFLARFDRQLRAGAWILSGSFTTPLRVRAGNRINADFGPLGSVAISIES